MKNLHFFITSLCLLFSPAIFAQYILTFEASGMDAYVGTRFEIRVTETATGDEVGRKAIDLDTADFTIDLYVFLHGRDYQVDFYADVDADGSYDAPPTDHAWRRSLTDVQQHTTITFTPDTDFTDIMMPDPFPFSTYDAVWGGKWMNLTFGSTDSIMASALIECDSIFGHFSTKGVFGNPETVSFDYAGIRPSLTDPAPDTIRFNLGPDWDGEILVIGGELQGDVANSGVGLSFTGTVGATQILALYEVSIGGSVFANGFFYIKELELLSSTDELTINLLQVLDVTCAGDTSGMVSLEVTGGVPEYDFLWSNGDTINPLMGVRAGSYTVTVTDAIGCTEDATFTIVEPDSIIINPEVQHVSCAGLCDGAINLLVSGGTGFYLYLWNTGNSSQALDGLCSGTYTITVADEFGCTAVLEIEVTEPPALELSSEATDVSCFGTCDGSITFSATGGTPPYFFPPPTDYCAGEYIVLVTDDNGCFTEDSVVIGSPEQLVVTSIDIQNATNGNADGQFTIHAEGGIGPYLYSINAGPLQASNTFSNLPAGTYCVFLIDAQECILDPDTCVTINNITGLDELGTIFTIYPNPVISELYIESDIPLSAIVHDITGKTILTRDANSLHKINLGNLPAGVYTLTVSDGIRSVTRRIARE